MKAIHLMIGLVPALVIGVWIWSVSTHEWFDLPSPAFLIAPLLALFAGVSWFLHSRSPKLPIAHLICFGVALLICVVRTDWIIGTFYVYMDSRPTYQTHIAPSTPLWSPPTPNDTIPGTKSWDDFEYFYHGGAGGPVETPQLKINFLATVSRLWVILLTAYTSCVIFSPKHKQ